MSNDTDAACVTVHSPVGCPTNDVKIGRHTYRIVWREEEKFFSTDDPTREILGETRFSDTELHISVRQSMSMIKDTLFHESLHAIGYEIGAMEFQQLAKVKGFELEEHIVTHYTPVLLDFMANNKLLINWLTS